MIKKMSSENEFDIPAKNCHRMVILGSTKVGKTAIISRFLNEKFDDQYTPTIEDFHRKFYSIRGDVFQLDILDTSGHHPFPAMRRLSILTGKFCFEVNKLVIMNVHRLPNRIKTYLECILCNFVLFLELWYSLYFFSFLRGRVYSGVQSGQQRFIPGGAAPEATNIRDQVLPQKQDQGKCRRPAGHLRQ